MSNALEWIGFITVIAALANAIATPFVVAICFAKLSMRMEAVELELAALDFDLNGPDDDPGDEDDETETSNVVAIGKKQA